MKSKFLVLLVIVLTALLLGAQPVLATFQPVLSYLNPASGKAGQQISLVGSHFGAYDPNFGYVAFSRGSSSSYEFYYAPLVYWTDTEIVVTVPAMVAFGKNYSVQMRRSAYFQDYSNAVLFRVDAAPIPASVLQMAPEYVTLGTTEVITGTNLGNGDARNKIHFGPWVNPGLTCYGGMTDTFESWTPTQIVYKIPALEVGCTYIAYVWVYREDWAGVLAVPNQILHYQAPPTPVFKLFLPMIFR